MAIMQSDPTAKSRLEAMVWEFSAMRTISGNSESDENPAKPSHSQVTSVSIPSAAAKKMMNKLKSPRGSGGGGSGKFGKQKTLRGALKNLGSFFSTSQDANLSPSSNNSNNSSNKNNNNNSVKWCSKCKSRKSAAGSDLCGDCAEAPSSKAQDLANEIPMVLTVHHQSNQNPKVISTKASASWSQVRYIVECEFGEEQVSKGIYFNNVSSSERVFIKSEEDWDRVRRLAINRYDIQLHLLLST